MPHDSPRNRIKVYICGGRDISLFTPVLYSGSVQVERCRLYGMLSPPVGQRRSFRFQTGPVLHASKLCRDPQKAEKYGTVSDFIHPVPSDDNPIYNQHIIVNIVPLITFGDPPLKSYIKL